MAVLPTLKTNSQAMMDLYHNSQKKPAGTQAAAQPSAGPPSTDTAASQGAGGYSAPKASQTTGGQGAGGYSTAKTAGGQASSPAGSSVQTAPQSNPLDEYYAQMKSAQRAAEAAQEAQTRAAVEALQGNRRTIEQDAEEAAKQAYISRMLTEKRLPQQLAATGSSGGMTDSAVLRMNSDYENSRNDIMNAKNNALADLNSQIAQVEATGDISLAQQQSEWAQQLAQMQWQLAQQEAERQQELELAAINASKSGSGSGTPYKPRLTYAQAKEQLEAGNTNDVVLEAAEYWGLPVLGVTRGSEGLAGPALNYYNATKRLSEQFGRAPTQQEMAQAAYSLAVQGADEAQIDAYLSAFGFDPRNFK